MSKLTLPEIQQRVTQAIVGTPLEGQVSDVHVRVADGDDEDVVRIIIDLRRSTAVGQPALAEVVRRIENALLDSEERFPSVRFSEAA